MEKTIKIFKKCEQINILSTKQSEYLEDSSEWHKLEKALVELECQIINDIVSNTVNESDTAVIKQYKTELIASLPIISLHILKYFNDEYYADYSEILSILTEESIELLNIIKSMQEDIIDEQRIIQNESAHNND